MTNRLELNWKLDGFVGEQRYYCSETPIDPITPPTPKAVLAGDVRTYVDADIEIGKTYSICMSSVRNGIEKFSEIKSVNVSNDPYFANVVSLLHFDEDFLDAKGGSWTRYGTGVTVNASGKFGACAKFQRVSGMQSGLGKVNPDFIIGANKLTIEFFVKLDPSKDCALFDMRKAQGSSQEVLIESDRGNLYFWQNGTYKIGPFSNQLNFSNFKHIALTRDENNLCRLFCAGQLLGSATVTTSFASDTVLLGMSRNVGPNSNAYDLEGFMDEVRVTNGVCRYISNFVPPEHPFTNN